MSDSDLIWVYADTMAVGEIHPDGRVIGALDAALVEAIRATTSKSGKVAYNGREYRWIRPRRKHEPKPWPARRRYRGYMIYPGTYYESFRELYARNGDILLGPFRGFDCAEWAIDRAIDGPVPAEVPTPDGCVD